MSTTTRVSMLPNGASQPARRLHWGRWGVHAVLLAYSLLALGPTLLIILNSAKSRQAIFDDAFSLPSAENFDLVGYDTVLNNSSFDVYFRNSFVVTTVSVLLVVLLSSMAGFALTEYDFKGNALLSLFLVIGVMIPIRLGTVSILKLMVSLSLINTLWSLILVYTAMGLPLGVFLMSQFMRQVPRELKSAARVDGASEYRVFGLVVPLVRPGMAAVAVFTMLPVWNDLWFPLILAPSEGTRTVTLGASAFLGQFERNWNALLAALTLAMVPILLLYIVFSRQFLRGLTEGAIK